MTDRIWRWLPARAVIALHDEQIATHGGETGIRNGALLEAILERPRRLAIDGEPDAAQCAAACMAGIARERPFVDANERTALVAAYALLRINGCELDAPEAETVLVVTDVAAGALTEAKLAAWLRGHVSEIAP